MPKEQETVKIGKRELVEKVVRNDEEELHIDYSHPKLKGLVTVGIEFDKNGKVVE